MNCIRITCVVRLIFSHRKEVFSRSFDLKKSKTKYIVESEISGFGTGSPGRPKKAWFPNVYPPLHSSSFSGVLVVTFIHLSLDWHIWSIRFHRGGYDLRFLGECAKLVGGHGEEQADIRWEERVKAIPSGSLGRIPSPHSDLCARWPPISFS
jgi:hypothetical protein